MMMEITEEHGALFINDLFLIIIGVLMSYHGTVAMPSVVCIIIENKRGSFLREQWVNRSLASWKCLSRHFYLMPPVIYSHEVF
jgi:hypothetical protein